MIDENESGEVTKDQMASMVHLVYGDSTARRHTFGDHSGHQASPVPDESESF